MTEKEQAAEITIRYVAGLAVKDDVPDYSVLALTEIDGERVGTAFVIPHMTQLQLDELHAQLSVIASIEKKRRELAQVVRLLIGPNQELAGKEALDAVRALLTTIDGGE